MFSGIIQSIGKISSFDGNLLVVEASEIANKNDISESISVNGACLTIVDKSSTTFSVNVVEETLKRTNLGKLSVGSNVNLESALRVGDKIGGHNVQGHIDCTTTIKKITKITPKFSTTGGTSDARFIRKIAPCLEFGLVGKTMHKVDEAVSIKDLKNLTKIYSSILKNYFQ